MKPFIYYVITLWWVLWLQIILNHFLGGSAFSINVVLIAALFFGLTKGPFTGQLLGAVWGLLIDASSLGLMGLHTVLYGAAGYAAGMVRRQLDETKPWTQAIYSLAISVVYWVVYNGLDHLFASADRPINWRTSLEPIMNAAFAPLVFWVLRRWSESWAMNPLER